MRKQLISTAVAAILVGCTGASTSANAAAGAAAGAGGEGIPTYSVDKVPLPGEGRGDYLTVDATARRLYVTHSAAVHVLDLDTLKPIAEIDGLKAAHGVALDPASGHGFVSDGDRNGVVMFDLATARTIALIPAGKKPDSILRDAASGMILAFNGDSEDVSVIDPAKGVVVKTIKLPAGPEFAQADGRGTVWVNLEEKNAVAVIDTHAMIFTRLIPLAGCDGPAPLSFDAVDRVLFSGCGNKVMTVTDADAGTVLATVPIGDDPDGIVFDAAKKRIYVANRAGGWTIVDQQAKARYAVEPPLAIDDYAKTVALDPATHRVFSSTADLVWPPAVPGKKHLPNAKPGTFRLMVVAEK